MVEYFTQGYFDALADVLNNDAEFQQKAASLTTRLLFVAKDKDRAFLVNVDKGKVAAEAATAETDADFTFTTTYDTWITNHRDGVTLEKLIMTGKVKFKGSLPRIMSLKGQLGAVDQKGQSIPADY